MRNDAYANEFDWTTLFYDVFRVGPDIVFLGPPFRNFLKPLLKSSPLSRHFGFFGRGGRYYKRLLANDIWITDSANHLDIAGGLGTYSLSVQPNMSDLFAGKRTIYTLSKDNEIEWIADWIRFHQVNHGADAALIYDNASAKYDWRQLNAQLSVKLPDMTVVVVNWPFKYGPQGGKQHGVNGRYVPWDSCYGQNGAFQHARFRFLLHAKSVLNLDVDELLISKSGSSAFEVAEALRHRGLRFNGRWISNLSAAPDESKPRHAHYFERESELSERCPAKWCATPLPGKTAQTWGAHRISGRRLVRRDDDFLYRHFRAISTNWKYDRSAVEASAVDHGRVDDDLLRAFEKAGLAG